MLYIPEKLIRRQNFVPSQLQSLGCKPWDILLTQGYKANVRAIAVGIDKQLVTGAPRTRANKNFSDEANVRASGDGTMEPTNSLL